MAATDSRTLPRDGFTHPPPAYQDTGGIKREDPREQAYVAWSAVHGLASLLIEGQIMSTVDVDALIRQTTQTVLDGMRA